MESYILYAACQDWGFYLNSRFSKDEKKSYLLVFIISSMYTEGPLT